MRLLNKTAIDLVNKLTALKIKFKPGYFGGFSYCVGIEVEKPDEIFNFGSMLGGGEYGKVEFYLVGRKIIIAFREALVNA